MTLLNMVSYVFVVKLFTFDFLLFSFQFMKLCVTSSDPTPKYCFVDAMSLSIKSY